MDIQNQRLRSVTLGRLESLERAGVMHLPKARMRPGAASAAPTPAPATVATNAIGTEQNPLTDGLPVVKPNSPQWASPQVLFDVATEKQPRTSKAASLMVLQQEVAACTQCSELARLRTNTVFGVGNPKARLCFMGEAPGADEDRLGEPFVGRAGQLLTKIIEACRLKREDVYILNMIKCRPPGNRNPLPDELTNCRGFLERQLNLIQPEFICCLGAVAAQNLLNTSIPIGKLRGKLHAYRGAKVVCTFHPAYLLRNPAAKKDAWDDMKFLFREMGIEL